MGCWNKTCGLSNLHITAGQRTYTFVIEQAEQHDRCYSTALWRPVLVPFTCDYDDYGAGEDWDEFFEPLIRAVAEELVEVPAGENRYHDRAVKRDGFDAEAFFEAVRTGRLATQGYSGATNAVDFVMMRADIVDHIVDNWVQEVYVGSGLGTNGHDNSYVEFKFADVVAQVPAFVERIAEQSLLEEKRLDMAIYGFGRNTASDRLDYVSSYLGQHRDHRHSQILNAPELVLDALDHDDHALAEHIVTRMLLGSHIERYMTATRRIWVPACHEGSQSCETAPYLLMCEAIQRAINADEQEWEDE